MNLIGAAMYALGPAIELAFMILAFSYGGSYFKSILKAAIVGTIAIILIPKLVWAHPGDLLPGDPDKRAEAHSSVRSPQRHTRGSIPAVPADHTGFLSGSESRPAAAPEAP